MVINVIIFIINFINKINLKVKRLLKFIFKF